MNIENQMRISLLVILKTQQVVQATQTHITKVEKIVTIQNYAMTTPYKEGAIIYYAVKNDVIDWVEADILGGDLNTASLRSTQTR